MIRSAEISPCGTWRYRLVREFADGSGTCCFVMLNPSTADGERDDPTIRRCIGFAQGWEYSRLTVVNLFALRCSDPDELEAAENPVGPANDAYLRREIDQCDLLVCAWGNRGTLDHRDAEVREWLRQSPAEPHCLGVTQAEQPKHPLYLPGDSQPEPWSRPSRS